MFSSSLCKEGSNSPFYKMLYNSNLIGSISFTTTFTNHYYNGYQCHAVVLLRKHKRKLYIPKPILCTEKVKNEDPCSSVLSKLTSWVHYSLQKKKPKNKIPNSKCNIYNRIIFTSLNPAKNFQFISWSTVNKKFGSWAESHAQWLIHKMKLRARYCGNFEFITFLWEF